MKKKYSRIIKIGIMFLCIIKIVSEISTIKSQAASYEQITIKIPKTIIMEIEPNGSVVEKFDISIIGEIENTKKVKIQAENSFDLYSKGKILIQANISQEKNTFTSKDSNKQAGIIKASNISAGTWKGNFNFTISVSDNYGLYDHNNNLIKSWDELLSEKIINVNNGVVTSQFNSNDYNNSSSNKLNGKLIMPDDVTIIGKYAFYNCINLTEVIAQNIKKIDDYGFYGCSGLKNIELKYGLSSIGEYAFYYCVSLNKITIPNSVVEIKSNAFRNCSSIKEIILPDNITAIGQEAFYYCLQLKKISIPNSIEELQSGIFKNCINLGEVLMSNSIKEIKEYAFFGCEKIRELNIPTNVRKIGNNAFFDVPFVKYNGFAEGGPWGAREIAN